MRIFVLSLGRFSVSSMAHNDLALMAYGPFL